MNSEPCNGTLNKLKLKIKLTTFGIVHHCNAKHFQVCLTVSKLGTILTILMVLEGCRQKGRLLYLAVSPQWVLMWWWLVHAKCLVE